MICAFFLVGHFWPLQYICCCSSWHISGAYGLKKNTNSSCGDIIFPPPLLSCFSFRDCHQSTDMQIKIKQSQNNFSQHWNSVLSELKLQTWRGPKRYCHCFPVQKAVSQVVWLVKYSYRGLVKLQSLIQCRLIVSILAAVSTIPSPDVLSTSSVCAVGPVIVKQFKQPQSI